MQYKEQAIPLLVAERDGKYSITSEAKSIITSIKTPIAVVSVAGLYRTGKSYLLNRMLLNRSNGFGVGPTVNPCTKGLWMWGAPVKTRTQEGQPLTLLIIDTEGLGATDEDDNHDNKIFSLAILLSTCFIYNSVGSIDENAIQSLNLVLNLSETIYQQSSNSKMDTRQLPSFFWVVRDFSLQLIDEKGTHITSKEYLENALALQKGFGKDVEEKNKVRKFIAECFTIRDCFTMVRPTNADNLLQELDKVPFEQLRPEFVEQVMNLRKRVLGRLQPKKINNNTLDGQSYFHVIKTYVDAINNGAVPNIQTAWEYICLERNQKLLNEAEEIFLKGIKDEVQYRIPCLDSEIRSIVQSVKRNALNHYSSSAWGEKNQAARQQLQAKIKQRQTAIYSQNQKQSVSAAQNIVVKQYQPINKKLKSSLYPTFSEFQHDIKSFYVFLMQHHRKFQSCQMVYMQFINKRILEGSQFFFKTLEQQVTALKETKTELSSKNEKQNSDLRAEYNKYKLQADEHISKVQREKVEAQFNLDQTKSQLSNLQAERQQLQMQKDSRISSLANEVEILTKELRSKDTMLENKVREGMREDCLKNAEWEKEKALYLQQEKFFKERIENLQKKQRQMEQQVSSAKNDLETRIKEITMRTQDKNKTLSQELMQKSDKLFQATGLVKKLQEDLKVLEDSSDLKQRKLRSEILDLQTSLEGFKNNDVVERNRLMTTNMNEKREILQLLDEEKEKVRMFQIQLREANEQLKHNKVSSERDQAIHSQKIQFQEIELKELKVKYSQLQSTHQNALLNCENASKEKILELQNSIMFDLKNSHERQIKQLESEWESKMRFAKNEVENYKRRKEELELTLQLQTKKNDDKEFEYKESIRTLEDACQKIQAEKLTSEQGTAHFKRQIEIHYETKIKRLEHELESVRDEGRKELNQAHEQSEITVRQLKSYYQLQKERLDRKIQEEKQKVQKKVKKVADDYQQRLTEEKIQFQQQLVGFKNNLSQVEQSYQQKISNIQYEFDITLQKTNDEFNDRRIQFQKQSALNQQQLDYANKRFENLNREKQSLQLRSEEKIKQIRNQLQEENRQMRERMNDEKSLIEQKYEKVKLSLREAEQNLNRLNIDFEKERTVLKSRQASLEARLSEIEQKSRLRVKLKEDELQKTIEAHEIEKSSLINEIQRFRLVTDKLEDEKNKLKSGFDSEKTLLLNKFSFLEQQSKRYKTDCEDIIQKFQTTVKHLSKERDKLINDKAQAVNEIALSLKSQSEREIDALKNNHQKIVRDFEDKINRLQTDKKNLNDKILNYEVRLSGQTNNIGDIEKKYQRDVDKLRKECDSRIEEYESTIDDLRRQVSGRKIDFDDRESKRLSMNQNIGAALANKVIPSSNIQYQNRESESRRSKITTIPQQVASGTSLLGAIGNVSNISNLSNFSGISKKSTYGKQKLFDLGDFGSPFSSKNKN